jgi:ABC-type polysaccharide/polyol phosphate export permease
MTGCNVTTIFYFLFGAAVKQFCAYTAPKTTFHTQRPKTLIFPLLLLPQIVNCYFSGALLGNLSLRFYDLFSI